MTRKIHKPETAPSRDCRGPAASAQVTEDQAPSALAARAAVRRFAGRCRWTIPNTAPAWLRRPPTVASFDHLVCAGEECGRYREAECFGGVEVDHEFDFGRLLDRKIGRLAALEDLVRLHGRPPG